MNTEDLLTDALQARTERTDYPSTPLATVAARARAVRARRRRTATLAAAAAVAVAVPGAVWLAPSPGSTLQPGQSVSSNPTSAATADATPLHALPMGTSPGIEYLVGDTYVPMNGDRVTSPDFAEALTATPVRGGILVSKASPPAVARAHGGLAPLFLVADGTSQSLGCGSDRFAMSTDGVQSAYWVADSCTPGGTGKLYSGVNNTMGESASGYVSTPPGSVFEPVGIVQQGTVVNVTHGSAEHAEIVDPSGSRSPISALAYVEGSDENNDVVSGVLAGDGTETGAVVDASTGAVKWRASWILGQFSADGQYVIGAQRVDGFPDNYAIFDATSGRKLLTWSDRSGPVWDTNDTLLSVERGADTAAIVRMDLQGDRSLATPIVHSASYWAGYRLATRP